MPALYCASHKLASANNLNCQAATLHCSTVNCRLVHIMQYAPIFRLHCTVFSTVLLQLELPSSNVVPRKKCGDCYFLHNPVHCVKTQIHTDDATEALYCASHKLGGTNLNCQAASLHQGKNVETAQCNAVNCRLVHHTAFSHCTVM